MKIFTPCCAQKERNRLGSEATSNLASGSRIDLMSRRTLLVNGSLAPCSHGSILATTELLESVRPGVGATYCLLAQQRTSGCAPECMSGWVWIGMLHIPTEHYLCLCATTSVSELHNNFDYTF